jgi:lysozyme
MYKGVDLSSIQGTNVDYNWLVQQGITFVIVRCGIGNNQHDPNYATNIANAKAVGLKTLAYHVAYPLPSDVPETVAEYHFSLANGERASSDVEFPYPQNWAARGMSAPQVRDWCNRYHAKYSELDGRQMLIYSYPSFLEACAFTSADYTASCPLWIASYTAKPVVPSPWKDWALWQWAGGTAMKLPNGSAIDTDYAPDLTLWQPSVPVTPTPAPLPEVAPTPDPVAANPTPAPTPAPAPPPPASGNIWTFISNLLSGLFKG